MPNTTKQLHTIRLESGGEALLIEPFDLRPRLRRFPRRLRNLLADAMNGCIFSPVYLDYASFEEVKRLLPMAKEARAA